MESGPPEAQELTREESLSLLSSAAVGRLVFTDGALPAVLPVAFVLDGGRIVVRTSATSSIASSVPGRVVAFEVDDVDLDRRTGWSVTVVGRAHLVQDPVELERLSALPLQPWVPGERRTYVVLDVGLVTGRRVGGPEPAHATRPEVSAGTRAGTTVRQGGERRGGDRRRS